MPRMPYPHCDQSCQNKPVSNASDNIKLKILEDKLRNDLVQKDLTDLPEVSEIKSSDYLYVYDSEQEQVKKISANEILNQVDLEDYAKKEDLADYAKKEEIPNIDGLATEQFVKDSISKIEIPDTDLSDYYNKSAIDDIIENIELKEGPAGKDGKDGENGQSAYELWLALGNTGTEADFITSLRGQDGEKGDDGHTPIITIQAGYWYIDGENTNVQANGLKGETGNGISSIQKTHTEGLVDTYTITFTNGETTTFTVTNGKDGEDGVNGKDGLTTAIKVGEITYTHENGIITLPQYIEEIPDEYITEEELNNKGYISDISGKQDTIEDLEEIRANAALGKTALQEVPAEYITETELEAKNYLTEHQSLDEYTKKTYVDQKVADLVDSAPETLNTLNELAVAINTHEDAYGALLETVGSKADKEHEHKQYLIKSDLEGYSKFSGSYNDLTDTPDIPKAYDDTELRNLISSKSDSTHNHSGEILYPSAISVCDDTGTPEICVGDGDETIIFPGYIKLQQAENGIELDTANNSYQINGSNIATEDYVDNVITKIKIGIDFTTNITLGHLEAGTKISKDQTLQEILYSILYKPTYDVKFIVDGTEYKTINIMQGEKVTKPMNPNKAGYEFKGWYTDETYSTPYNFNNKIMSETSIYALFEEITTVQVQYIECCEPDGDILDTAYSQELQKGQLVPMPSIDTIRERITDGWEWDGNFYFDRECTEYFDFENTYVTSDLHIYLKITQLPEGPIIPEGSVVEEIVTNNIPAYSGSTSNGETEVTYQLLDGNTAEPTEQGFYTITDDNNEVVQAGYQLTMEGNTNMDAQVFAVPLNASMVKAWQYDEMGKTWLEYDFPGDYWRAGEIITKTVDGTEIEYQTYYYNVEDIGDAISSDEYWRFEMEVNN